MDNNDILRRLRYTFDTSEWEMASIFAHSGTTASRETFSCWLRREEEPEFIKCKDRDLARFLNGLIIHRRGRRVAPLPKTEALLTNNTILLKLKIALNLRAEEILELLALAGMTLGKGELSAFFRRPGHKHFRQCKDQILRNFLTGLQRRYRPDATPEPREQDPWARALRKT